MCLSIEHATMELLEVLLLVTVTQIEEGNQMRATEGSDVLQ